MAEQVVFSSVMEALFPAEVRRSLSAPARERLRQLGLDLDRPFHPAYPIGVWAEAVRMLEKERYPQLPTDAAQQQLGEDFMNQYAETLVAKALFALLRVMGPRRAMHRLARNFKSGGSDVEVSVRELAPDHFEIRFQHILVPAAHYLGMMLAASRHSGASNVRGRILETTADACALDIRWGPNAGG
jgi:uncharacterized protein (TIGR02265 family)